MLEPLIDTLIVCSITAFVILISGEWLSGINGAALTTSAFNQGLPFTGKYCYLWISPICIQYNYWLELLWRKMC